MSSCVSTVLLLWGLVLSASATGQEQRPQTRCQVTGPLVISRPTRRIRTSRLSAAIAPRRHRVRDGQTSGRGTRDAGRGTRACLCACNDLFEGEYNLHANRPGSLPPLR